MNKEEKWCTDVLIIYGNTKHNIEGIMKYKICENI